MLQHQRNTISFRLLSLLLMIFVLFLSFVTINNAIIINNIQNNAYHIMKDNLTMYNNRLKDNLNKSESYLISFALDDLDIQVLDKNDTSSIQWFSALYRLQKNLHAALPIYKMDGFFIYSVPADTMIMETESNFSYIKSKIIKDTICPLMKNNQFIEGDNKDKWFPIQIEDQFYLFKVLRIHNSYIGTWINVDSALYPLVGNQLTKIIFLADSSGKILSNYAPIYSLDPSSLNIQNNYQKIKIDKDNRLLVSVKADYMNAYLVALIPKNQIFVDTKQYFVLLIIALSCMLCLMICTVFLTKRWVIQPLSSLFIAISSLHNGNLDTVVSNKNASAEFSDVYKAFNEMVGQIKTLKIDVYEEKLSRQHVQMQYLKSQIAPHFLINCLSMVYQLSEIGNLELSKIMLKDLSNHLRYTLSSGETVSLEQEINHVKNYIELSNIRYPNGINLFLNCNTESLSATVVPLLLQNFVENTIKHEALVGKLIDIHIRILLVQKEETNYLKICIWDTGSGFNQDVLDKLQNVPKYLKENQSKHIGISNVFERTFLVFGNENCHFSFSNRQDAGAQIDIEIPYIPFFKEEEH